jgi:ribosomal protein S27AE
VQKGKSISKTKKDPEWIVKIGTDSYRRTAENTDQYAKGRAISKTKNELGWKNTVGASSSEKRKNTMSDPTWKETVGASGHRKRVQSVDYDIVGRKISEKRADPEWIQQNSKTCPHCGATTLSAPYARYHGDRCKLKIEDATM